MRLSLPPVLPDRRRITSFVLALAVEAALIALLLTFGPHFTAIPKPARSPSTFSLTPSAEEAATSPERHTTKQTARTSAAAATTSRSAPPVPVPPTAPAPWDGSLPGVLPIELGAQNISKLKSSAPPEEKSDRDQTDSRLARGPGLAPDGQPYYMGDWYRAPTVAEIAPYLPRKRLFKGWGLIVCKTAPRYHVEDCRIVGESPAGSGMGRAALNMSWQFLLRPPRLGGKDLLGAWIGVRVDYLATVSGDKTDAIVTGGDQPDDPK